MKVVLDTNIIISAALRPDGNPGQIIKLAADSDELQLFYSKQMLDEYIEVLSREHFNFSETNKLWAINSIEKSGVLVEPPVSTIPLPDETDRIFYDTAKQAEATLVTGNIKHYPQENFIMTPRQFIDGLSIADNDLSDDGGAKSGNTEGSN